MPAPAPSQLDSEQILPHAFDDATGKLRVDAEITANISGSQEVTIAAIDDNIAIRGTVSGNELEPNVDGSINTFIQNQLITSKWDSFSVAYPSGTQEIYTYKFGGLSGSTVATITINYSDITKTAITTLVKA
jgi:hypothetical protein